MALFSTKNKKPTSLYAAMGGTALDQKVPAFGEDAAALLKKKLALQKPAIKPAAANPNAVPPVDVPNVYRPNAQPVARANQQQPATVQQDALAKGGTPASTVPEANQPPTVADVNLPGKPLDPNAGANPYNPGNLFNARHYDAQGNPSPQIKSVVDYDNSILNSPPSTVQSDTDRQTWNDSVKREQENFAREIEQYPDQFDKIFQNHQKRMNDLKTKWDTQGKYNSQLDDMLAQQFPGLKVSVKDVPEAQQNAFYQQAIAALQAGKSPQEIAGIYKAMFPAGYDFSIGAIPGATKENIDKYVPIGAPGVTQSGADIGKTDTSGINTTGQTETGAKVTQAEIDALNKELGAQPLTEDEKNKILAGDFAAIDADKQAAMRRLVSSGAAAGFGTNLASIVNATAGTAQKYDTQKAQMRGELTRQNLSEVQARRQAAISGLGEVAAREAGVAGTQAQAGLGAAGITSQENIQRGQLQLAKDSLFQEGQLTSAGQQINQQLQAYGFSLDKVLADQNFNLDNFKNQLQEKIANQTGDIESAKLQADNITKSIQFAMDETQLDNARNGQLAELQLKAAQGDQQAKLDVQQLQVEQELRGLGLENDYADRLGGWLLSLLQGREQLSQQNEQFLKQLEAQAKANKANGLLSVVSGILQAGATVAAVV